MARVTKKERLAVAHAKHQVQTTFAQKMLESRQWTEDYTCGRMDGANAELESILFGLNEYRGFMYTDPTGAPIVTENGHGSIREHPSYKEWRRRYF